MCLTVTVVMTVVFHKPSISIHKWNNGRPVSSRLRKRHFLLAVCSTHVFLCVCCLAHVAWDKKLHKNGMVSQFLFSSILFRFFSSVFHLNRFLFPILYFLFSLFFILFMLSFISLSYFSMFFITFFIPYIFHSLYMLLCLHFLLFHYLYHLQAFPLNFFFLPHYIMPFYLL